MARRFTGGRLVIASHNPGKLREIAELVAPFGVEALSAAGLGLSEPEETGASFAENAALKARAATAAARLPALADDSGLEVAALGGAPGNALAGSGGGLAVGGVTSRTWNATFPNASTSPSTASASMTRDPLRNVPLLEPRSRIDTPLAPMVTSAWRREIVGS